MNDFSDSGMPDELQDVEQRLRMQRAEASPLELDQLKQRAMAQARRSAPRRGGIRMRSRAVTLLLSALLIGGTTAGGIAGGGGKGKHDNAGNSQYHCDEHANHPGHPCTISHGNKGSHQGGSHQGSSHKANGSHHSH
jgi:hypothetical protein